MKLKPGCGCLLIVLSLANIVLLVSTIIAATRQNLTALGGIGMSLVFGANALAVGMLGFWAFQGRVKTENGSAEGDATMGEGSDAEVEAGEVIGKDTEDE